MSFGGSPSDVFAAVKFTAKIVSALKKDGGSQSKYQDAVQSLESLQASLQSILEDFQHLAQSQPLTANGDNLRSQINRAQAFVSEFERKIQKYEEKLGAGARSGVRHGTLRKIDFALRAEKDLQEFRKDLEFQLQAIKFSIGKETLNELGAIKNDAQAHQELLERSRIEAQAHADDHAVQLRDMQAQVTDSTASLQSRLDIGFTGLVRALGRLELVLASLLTRSEERLVEPRALSSEGSPDPTMTQLALQAAANESELHNALATSQESIPDLNATSQERSLEQLQSVALSTGQRLLKEFLKPSQQSPMAILVICVQYFLFCRTVKKLDSKNLVVESTYDYNSFLNGYPDSQYQQISAPLFRLRGRVPLSFRQGPFPVPYPMDHKSDRSRSRVRSPNLTHGYPHANGDVSRPIALKSSQEKVPDTVNLVKDSSSEVEATTLDTVIPTSALSSETQSYDYPCIFHFLGCTETQRAIGTPARRPLTSWSWFCCQCDQGPYDAIVHDTCVAGCQKYKCSKCRIEFGTAYHGFEMWRPDGTSFHGLGMWRLHVLSHFHGQPPPKEAQCPLCPKKITHPAPNKAWNIMLDHLGKEHLRYGQTLDKSRPDFALYKFLFDRKIINEAQYKALSIASTSEGQQREHSGGGTPTKVPKWLSKCLSLHENAAAKVYANRREREIPYRTEAEARERNSTGVTGGHTPSRPRYTERSEPTERLRNTERSETIEGIRNTERRGNTESRRRTEDYRGEQESESAVQFHRKERGKRDAETIVRRN